MLTTSLLAVWLAMWIAPETPIGRFLKRWLMAAPAARLARVRRETVLTFAVLGLIGIGVAVVLGAEMLQLFGMAAPEIATTLIGMEVWTYVDALLAVAAMASTVRWSALRIVIAQRLRRPRAARARRVRRADKPSANDDDAGAELLAA